MVNGIDLYFNRGWDHDPRFGYVREPGSVEFNVLGWTLILSWAPVQCTALTAERDNQNGRQPTDADLPLH